MITRRMCGRLSTSTSVTKEAGGPEIEIAAELARRHSGVPSSASIRKEAFGGATNARQHSST